VVAFSQEVSTIPDEYDGNRARGRSNNCSMVEMVYVGV